MDTSEAQSASGCPRMNRRRLLLAAGGAAAALEWDVFRLASSLLAAEPKPKPATRIGVVFVRRTTGGGVTWPTGTTEQLRQMQALFTQTMAEEAKKLGVQLEVKPEPVMRDPSGYLQELKKRTPDGVIIVAMALNGWRNGTVAKLVNGRGDIPAIVYANVSAFAQNYATVAGAPKTFLGTTPDVGWLKQAVRMLDTVRKAKSLKLVRCPTKDYYDQYKKVSDSKELRALAEFYGKRAKKVVEPGKEDILAAVKHYIVLRRILAAEGAQGITVRGPLCIGGKNPACVAVSRLLDEGFVAACEDDRHAAMCQFLTLSLFELPGLMGNPSPNTVDNTLILSHCTSALKLEGTHKPYRAPFVLRDFHAMSGAVPMVAWPVGRTATVMDFYKGDLLVIGAGRVVGNTEKIAQPPCGGCRTSVEFAFEGRMKTLHMGRGHHMWCVLGDVARPMQAYCRLAGIKVADLTGKPLAAAALTEKGWTDVSALA